MPIPGQRSAVEVLTKVLTLELRQNCADTAAIGGMADLVQSWRERLLAAVDDTKTPHLEQLTTRFAHYPELSSADRRQLAEQMRQQLKSAPESRR